MSNTSNTIPLSEAKKTRVNNKIVKKKKVAQTPIRTLQQQPNCKIIRTPKKAPRTVGIAEVNETAENTPGRPTAPKTGNIKLKQKVAPKIAVANVEPPTPGVLQMKKDRLEGLCEVRVPLTTNFENTRSPYHVKSFKYLGREMLLPPNLDHITDYSKFEIINMNKNSENPAYICILPGTQLNSPVPLTPEPDVEVVWNSKKNEGKFEIISKTPVPVISHKPVITRTSPKEFRGDGTEPEGYRPYLPAYGDRELSIAYAKENINAELYRSSPKLIPPPCATPRRNITPTPSRTPLTLNITPTPPRTPLTLNITPTPPRTPLTLNITQVAPPRTIMI